MAEALDHPPACYSVHQADYNHDLGRRIRVLVNGVEQDRVVSYDASKGTVLRYKTDTEGHITLRPDRQAAETVELQGNVTVEWKD